MLLQEQLILHCTSMLAIEETFPQVLFAWHLYCLASALVMLVIFNQFPSWTALEGTGDQVTVGTGYPGASQYKDTLLPSSTILFCIGFTDAGTTEK